MRCNVGINPVYLADQHLIVEARELGMVAGSLKYHNFKVVSGIPDKLSLGKGHLNFFKNKLAYLRMRWVAVVQECTVRGFNIQKPFYDLSGFPKEFCYDWWPTDADSAILRGRVIEKINMKSSWYRYRSVSIGDGVEFCEKLRSSPLYYV